MQAGTTIRLARLLDLAVYPLLPLLVVAPALHLPRELGDPFRTGAEAAVVVAAWLLVALVVTARGLAGRSPLPTGGQAGPWVLGLLAWSLVVTPLALHPQMHFGHWLTLLPLTLAALAVSAWIRQAPLERARWTLGSLGALMLVELMFAVVQHFRVPLEPALAHVAPGSLAEGLLMAVRAPMREQLVAGGFGNPNFLAEFLALLVPVWVGLAATFRARWTRVLGVAVAGLGCWVLALTAARSAVLGLALAVVVGLPVAWLARRATGRVATAGDGTLVLAGTLGAAALAALAGGTALWQKLMTTGLTDPNVASRLGNWQAGLHGWLGAPVWGSGFGSVAAESQGWLLALAPTGVSRVLSEGSFLELHNEPLQVLVELGLVGLVILGVACWRWERGLHRAEGLPLAIRLGLLLGVVALGLASLAGFPAHIPLTGWALALVVGVGMGLCDRSEPEMDPAPAAAPRLGLACLLAFGALGWTAVQRGVGAEVLARHEVYVARQVARRDHRSPVVGGLFEAAASHSRFEAWMTARAMEEHLRRDDAKAALAVFDRHPAAGSAFDVTLMRGMALEKLGRLEEARAPLEQAARFYHPALSQHRKAANYLKRLGVPDPRQAERDQLEREKRPTSRDAGQAET